MAKVILLRGNSGCGKSTTAKLLQEKLGLGTLLIPYDVVRRQLLNVRESTPGALCLKLMREMATWGAKHCDVVIVEGILATNRYDPLFRTLQAEFDQVFAYYYDISFEETLRRHATKPNCNDFGEKEMRSWWREKDYIGWLPEMMIPAEMSQEETVEMIYREVTS